MRIGITCDPTCGSPGAAAMHGVASLGTLDLLYVCHAIPRATSARVAWDVLLFGTPASVDELLEGRS